MVPGNEGLESLLIGRVVPVAGEPREGCPIRTSEDLLGVLFGHSICTQPAWPNERFHRLVIDTGQGGKLADELF
jgi:hypothetical protein